MSQVIYRLVRITPSGDTKEQGPFLTVKGAAKAAGMVLFDNGAAGRAETQRFSAALARKPIGTEWGHGASGYRFRIVRVGGEATPQEMMRQLLELNAQYEQASGRDAFLRVTDGAAGDGLTFWFAAGRKAHSYREALDCMKGFLHDLAEELSQDT